MFKKLKLEKNPQVVANYRPIIPFRNCFSNKNIVAVQSPVYQQFCGNQEKLLKKQELKNTFLLIQLLSNFCSYYTGNLSY